MRFVIFHGAYGNANGNWFPWLKDELLKLKQEVILEQFPTETWEKVEKVGPSFVGSKQTLPNWIKAFEEKILPQISKKDKLCFIGHSLGPQFILHLIAKFNIQLDSAIFVMPFQRLLGAHDWMFDVVNRSFMTGDFDYNKLRRLIPLSFAVYSDNDKYVLQEYCEDFALRMQSTKIVVKGGDHINAPFFTKLPLALELCKTRIDASEYDH
ncbi:alpha/beta hydrolase [Candidatus Roizmanbacteria bacterium]|nr:alpha/beta hydrolase [Candidatus Roizmanbacteria bacterium]